MTESTEITEPCTAKDIAPERFTNMTIETRRITNYKDIDVVMKHDSVYPHICDDYSDSPDQFDTRSLVENDNVFFIGCFIGKIAGVFFYHPHSIVLYEVHSAVLPDYRGNRAIDMAKQSLRWMFKNTACRKVITHVPAYNRPAYSLAKRSGMIVEGKNRESLMKNGKMIDQIVLGITKEELLCQQQ